MRTLTPSQENYLEWIYRLSLDGPMRMGDLATKLGVKAPSASRAVTGLVGLGLVIHQVYGRIELTWGWTRQPRFRKSIAWSMFSAGKCIPGSRSSLSLPVLHQPGSRGSATGSTSWQNRMKVPPGSALAGPKSTSVSIAGSDRERSRHSARCRHQTSRLAPVRSIAGDRS